MNNNAQLKARFIVPVCFALVLIARLLLALLCHTRSKREINISFRKQCIAERKKTKVLPDNMKRYLSRTLIYRLLLNFWLAATTLYDINALQYLVQYEPIVDMTFLLTERCFKSICRQLILSIIYKCLSKAHSEISCKLEGNISLHCNKRYPTMSNTVNKKQNKTKTKK